MNEGEAEVPKDPTANPDGPRNVLVTGGAGFIGSHVAEGYLNRGDRVWILDDLSIGKRENIPEAATLVKMSIQDPGVGDLFDRIGFDLISHHAAQTHVRASVEDPVGDAQTNVLGLVNLLEAARRTGTRRVVYVSSGEVIYGEPEAWPTPETAPKLPLLPYGVAKLAGEFYLHYYRRVHGLEYVALRYSNVYGPRQDPHGEAGVVAIFSNRLLAGEELLIFGNGEQTRDYVYVADVVRANLMASEIPLESEGGLDEVAFNVGTGVGTSVNRLADTLEAVSGLRTGRSFRSPRPGELQHSTLDIGRFQRRGWTPRFTLEEGLRNTFRWIAGRSPDRASTEAAS